MVSHSEATVANELKEDHCFCRPRSLGGAKYSEDYSCESVSLSDVLSESMMKEGSVVALVYTLHLVMSAQTRAFATSYSRGDYCVSSSSGRHKILPICARVKPWWAASLRRVPVILMFLKQMGLMSKLFSKCATSASTSSLAMYSRVFFENG